MKTIIDNVGIATRGIDGLLPLYRGLGLDFSFKAFEIPCEYVGFDIPDVFVVGYGLDYNNYYRNLPDIGTLRPEVM